MAITFNTEITFKLNKPTLLRAWIQGIIRKLKKEPGAINYVFVDDASLLKMNIQYLKHNTLTDIITFDYTEGKKVSGDIYISVERVRENAEKFEVGFEEELRRVMIHGVLHLCGFKDKTKTDAAKMRLMENKALSVFKK